MAKNIAALHTKFSKAVALWKKLGNVTTSQFISEYNKLHKEAISDATVFEAKKIALNQQTPQVSPVINTPEKPEISMGEAVKKVAELLKVFNDPECKRMVETYNFYEKDIKECGGMEQFVKYYEQLKKTES